MKVNECSVTYRSNDGMNHLTDIEVLSLIIGGKYAEIKAKALYEAFDFDLTTISRKKHTELTEVLSTNEAKKVVASFEIGRRKMLVEAKEKTLITSSRDIQQIMFPLMGHLQHEECWIILLNQANKVLSVKKLHVGGVTACVVDIKMILKEVLLCGATGFIVCHNHPSGSTKPSQADNQLTNKIKESAKTMDIAFLDHVIIADRQYYSYADDGVV